MDPARPKPGLFAYRWALLPPTPGAHQRTGHLLRIIGWLTLAWGASRILAALAFPPSGALPAGAVAPYLLFEVGSALAWTAIWSYFASYTYFHWARRERRGLWHAWIFSGFLLAAGLVGLGQLVSAGNGLHGTTMLLLGLATVLPNVLLGGALLWLATRPASRSAFAPAPPAEPVPRPATP